MIHSFDKRLQYIKNAYDKYRSVKDAMDLDFHIHKFTNDPMLKDNEFIAFYATVIAAYYDGYAQGKKDQMYSNEVG